MKTDTGRHLTNKDIDSSMTNIVDEVDQLSSLVVWPNLERVDDT